MEHTTLVALTPAEMPAAQAELASWLDQKLAAVETELGEVRENLQIAITRKWKHTNLKAIVGRTERLKLFYQKVLEAVRAGYLIVPAMDCEVFAVRIDRKKTSDAVYSWESSAARVDAQLLPSGQGRYVAPEATTYVDQVERDTDANGKETVTKWYAANEFQDVAFPVSLIKPQVMDATGRAMALKIFDEIGIVIPRHSRKADPFVIGRIRDPRKFRAPQTFFIAWWLDTRSL